MTTVEPHADSAPATPPLCPTCALPAQDPKPRADELIVVGDFICALGHIWRVLWLVDAQDWPPAA